MQPRLRCMLVYPRTRTNGRQVLWLQKIGFLLAHIPVQSQKKLEALGTASHSQMPLLHSEPSLTSSWPYLHSLTTHMEGLKSCSSPANRATKLGQCPSRRCVPGTN